MTTIVKWNITLTICPPQRLSGPPRSCSSSWLIPPASGFSGCSATVMNMSSPALSHHLKLLKACGLIVSRREGKEVYYRAADNVQAAELHHVIEHVAEIACPD